MEEHLKTLKQYLREARKFNSPVLKAAVFGNTSADMDSCVGAICMSWYLGMQSNIKYTPVIYCTKDELRLRGEIIEHMALFGLDEAFLHENVIFTCDFAGSHNEFFGNIQSLGLVDFNKLTKNTAFLEHAVHYILDHHVDQGLYAKSLKEKKIQVIGSATTLVAEKLLYSTDVFKDLPEQEVADLALFISAPIYLDTIGFMPEMKTFKWLDVDWDTFQTLMKHCSSQNPEEYLSSLKHTKYNVMANIGLGCRNNFIKNFKAFDYITSGPITYGIGISSIYIPVREMVDHYGLKTVASEMQRLMDKKNLGLFIIITKHEKGPDHELVKEMALFRDNQILNDFESQYSELK